MRLALLLTYTLLIASGLVIALRAPINYHRYLAAGISTYFTCQVIMIIAGNIRLLPLTGVTLPFISYGGSSLLTSFAAVLILVLISRQSVQDPAPLVRLLSRTTCSLGQWRSGSLRWHWSPAGMPSCARTIF